MTKILVFGKNGQVARALKKALPFDALFLEQSEANFQKPESLTEILDRYQPKIVINAAAYTAVDRAESEADLCFKINADAPQKIAEWCAKHHSLLIHFSTDYVYQGEGTEAQSEEMATGPLSVYGNSKKMAEDLIRASGTNYVILRTSWVYDETGTNFVRTMLRLASEREELKVVSDQIGSPTYAGDLADAVNTILSAKNINIKETYNVCGSGFVSWYDFAQEIFGSAQKMGLELKIQSVVPIKTEEYKTAAIRPLNSRMSQAKIKKDFGIELPSWQESLKKCLSRMELR